MTVLSSTLLMSEKMAVFAPIPSASVSTATAVKPGFFSNWRKANLRSFITQCLHGSDFHGSACGHVTGRSRHADQQHRHYGQDDRVSGLHLIKLIGQDAC